MSVIPILVALGLGCGLILVLRRDTRATDAVGIGAAAIVLVAAILLTPGERVTADGGALVTTDYSRVLLIALAGAWLLLAIVEVVARRPLERDGPSVHLTGLIGLAAVVIALCAADPAAGTWAIAAGSVIGLGAAFLGRAGPTGTEVSAGGLRASGIAAALSVVGVALGTLTIGGPDPDATTGRLAFIGVAGGLALRSAAVPVHGWAARLADAVPGPSLAPLFAWLPAAAGVVALAWADVAASPFAAELGTERAILVVVGIATIGLASLAAWLVDDLAHVVAYLAIAATGLTLLGVAAVDPATWAPTRAWVAVAAIGVTALAAWLVVLVGAYGTRRVGDLAGWARRSPVLAVALAITTVALVGAPGLQVLTDRIAIVDGAIPGPAGLVLRVLLFAPLVAPARILVIGLRPIGDPVAAGVSERLRRPDRETAHGDGAPAEAPGRRATAERTTRIAMASIADNRLVIGSVAVLGIAALTLILAAGVTGLGSAADGAPPGIDAPIELTPDPVVEGRLPISRSAA